jgi:hypothetical protein
MAVHRDVARGRLRDEFAVRHSDDTAAANQPDACLAARQDGLAPVRMMCRDASDIFAALTNPQNRPDALHSAPRLQARLRLAHPHSESIGAEARPASDQLPPAQKPGAQPWAKALRESLRALELRERTEQMPGG